MTLASNALALGFQGLLATSGEPLVLAGVGAGAREGVGVTGVIDRQPDPKRYPRELNFDPHRGSVIEIAATFTPAPKVGELFTDETGTKHRIQMVRIIDGSHHRCFCVAP